MGDEGGGGGGRPQTTLTGGGFMTGLASCRCYRPSTLSLRYTIPAALQTKCLRKLVSDPPLCELRHIGCSIYAHTTKPETSSKFV